MLSISKTKQSAKDKKSEKKKTYDPLFDNPAVKQFRDSLSPEERQKYDKIGQELYNTINFETGETEETLSDVYEQLKAMLNSGLHPSYLTYEERSFLESYKGKNWFKDFGYLENDLNRVNF